MPEGEILTPATTEVSTPSTESSAPVESSTPAKIDYSKVSDNDIAAMELPSKSESPVEESESDSEDTATTSEAAPVESKPVVKDAESADLDSDDEDSFQEPEPDNLKRAFKTHPELRDAFYRDKKFREVIGSVKEARGYKELFPTVEDARMASDHAQALLTLDNLYVTDPADLLTKLHRGNAQAFENLMGSSREVFYALNPTAYGETVAKPVIMDYVENVRETAESEGDENLVAAMDILRNRMGWDQKDSKVKAQPAYDPRIKKLEDYERRDADQYRNSLYSFGASADQGVVEGIRAEIEATFNRLPANGILPGVKAVVAQQLLSEVMQALDANKYLTNIYNAQKLKGDFSENHFRGLVNSRLAQAKPLIGKRVVSMLKKLTADTLATNQKELKQGVEASQRKDVGAGSGQSVSPARSGKIDYRRTSNEDIARGTIKYKS